jgi:hypothetical protein
MFVDMAERASPAYAQILGEVEPRRVPGRRVQAAGKRRPGNLDRGVRAYVAGEAIWSRAQKNAIYSLQLYLSSGDEALFDQYRISLGIPPGDRSAGLALDQAVPDLDLAHAGLLQGGNHPDDLAGMIWLFRYFKDVSYLKVAIEQWAAADDMLLQLTMFGDAIKSEMNAGLLSDDSRLKFLSSELYRLNSDLTARANAFSQVLGEGSCAIKVMLTLVNICAAVILVLLVVWHTRRLLQQREAFEAALKAERRRLA